MSACFLGEHFSWFRDGLTILIIIMGAAIAISPPREDAEVPKEKVIEV